MKDPRGFAVIDKPAGITSHDCVSRLRKLFGIKRIGHGGTLDPSVTGVLPIAIGEATRLLPYLPGDKTYLGTIQLGLSTSTDDIEGEATEAKPWPKLSEDDLNRHLNKFRGIIKQRPPQVSSIHFKGERAYKRVLRGENLILPPREREIYKLSLLDWNQELGQLKIQINCAAGTYIRSIARDLGELLECGGCLAELRRIKAMGFNEIQAEPFPPWNKNKKTTLPKIITPINGLKHIPSLQLRDEKELLLWRTGRSINSCVNQYKNSFMKNYMQSIHKEQGVVVVTNCEEEFEGIGLLDNNFRLQPKIVFNAIG